VKGDWGRGRGGGADWRYFKTKTKSCSEGSLGGRETRWNRLQGVKAAGLQRKFFWGSGEEWRPNSERLRDEDRRPTDRKPHLG